MLEHSTAVDTLPGGLLLDFASVFPSLSHEWLFRVLRVMLIPEALLRIVAALYDNFTTTMMPAQLDVARARARPARTAVSHMGRPQRDPPYGVRGRHGAGHRMLAAADCRGPSVVGGWAAGTGLQVRGDKMCVCHDEARRGRVHRGVEAPSGIGCFGSPGMPLTSGSRSGRMRRGRSGAR